MTRAEWGRRVGVVMRRDCCVDTADAGVSAAELERYWRDGETPEAFVAWFAEKYDLIRFERNPFRPDVA